MHRALVAAVLVVSGCASSEREQPVEIERYRVTALQGQPRLAVVITRNEDCVVDPTNQSESCTDQDITPRQSEQFVRCLADGFRDSDFHPDVHSLDADPALRTALVQVPTENLLNGEIVQSLDASGALARLGRERVSHVVAFALKVTRNYRQGNDAEAGKTSGDGFGVGVSSINYFRVDFSGSIIDVPAAALAGRIRTNAEGGSGVAGGFVIPLPFPIPIPIIFPVFDNLNAEGDSCDVLGDAMALFLYSKSRPREPAAPP